MSKNRILSGIQPTGRLHLGNYIGALMPWVEHQHDNDNYFCIVDLHTLTIPEDMTADIRREKVKETLGIYLACGLDPKACAIFIQSYVKAHTELAWILNCVTPLGWLERMTQYKSKAGHVKSIGTGLLDYPVLMAADILLYDTDVVPVGEDQKQHVELACDIARRFNHLFGETLKIPKVVIRKEGARIMGFDDPTNKMSKSLGEKGPTHLVGLLDSEKRIKKTIMSAVTDSGSEVTFENNSPGVKNLLAVYKVLSGDTDADIQNRFTGKMYGHLKKDVLEVVLNHVRPIQERYHTIVADEVGLKRVIDQGTKRASKVANATMDRVRNAVGI